MEDEGQKELQLLPTPHPTGSSSSISQYMASSRPSESPFGFRSGPVDLQLSISVRPMPMPMRGGAGGSCVEAVKWEAAEQIRAAAMEKAYAERVREVTKREIELAEREFARAREMWERAREEMEKAERMKQTATRRIMDSTCMEITCQSCRHTFRPS